MPAVRIQFLFLQQTAAGRRKNRSGQTGTAGWIRSRKYVGVDDESTLNVNVAIL